MIARSASGSFRDAIGTLDQLVTYGGSKVALEDVLEVLDVADAELIFGADRRAHRARSRRRARARRRSWPTPGRDPVQFMRDLTAHLRQLVVIQTLGEAPDSFSVTADQTARLEAQARELPQNEAVRAIDLVADALAAVKEGSDPRIQLEVALLKAARPRADASVEALLLRIEQLERAAAARHRRPGRRRTSRPTRRPARKDEPGRSRTSPSRLAEAPPHAAAARATPSRGHRDALAGRARARPRRARAARCSPRCSPTRARRRSRTTSSCSCIRSRPRSASARSRTRSTASGSRRR